jgi:hypothetical protein
MDSGESNKDNAENISALFRLRLFLYQSYNYTIFILHIATSLRSSIGPTNLTLKAAHNKGGLFWFTQ